MNNENDPNTDIEFTESDLNKLNFPEAKERMEQLYIFMQSEAEESAKYAAPGSEEKQLTSKELDAARRAAYSVLFPDGDYDEDMKTYLNHHDQKRAEELDGLKGNERQFVINDQIEEYAQGPLENNAYWAALESTGTLDNLEINESELNQNLDPSSNNHLDLDISETAETLHAAVLNNIENAKIKLPDNTDTIVGFKTETIASYNKTGGGTETFNGGEYAANINDALQTLPENIENSIRTDEINGYLGSLGQTIEEQTLSLQNNPVPTMDYKPS